MKAFTQGGYGIFFWVLYSCFFMQLAHRNASRLHSEQARNETECNLQRKQIWLKQKLFSPEGLPSARQDSQVPAQCRERVFAAWTLLQGAEVEIRGKKKK